MLYVSLYSLIAEYVHFTHILKKMFHKLEVIKNQQQFKLLLTVLFYGYT